MVAGLILAAALLNEASDAPAAPPAPKVYGPAAPAPARTAPPVKTAEAACPTAAPDPKSQVVLVCAVKPQGYRIDPDVLAARKAKRQAMAGRPKRPENLKDHSCQVVGPAPCMDAPMVNVLGAAALAAEIADRLSKGQEIGSLFVTNPQMSEYQYYLAAKKDRETKEAEKAAKAAKAANAQATTASSAQNSAH